MWIRSCGLTLSFLLLGSLTAQDTPDNKLPDDIAKALEKADEITIYSLNGELSHKDGWHGAKVLGQTTLTQAKDRKTVVAAIKKGIEEGSRGARCFIPRHGLRAKYQGSTYDFLICFECRWVYIYTNAADKPLVLLISEAPEKTFNKILIAAKIELAKPEMEEKD
ncbi:MAG: hypothetical protein RMJ56_00950 [Gemmataceae bacterium]|nr:hypothetical protein [Gemmata sp.]MDW8196149.1 hypothetical protein [Gemmataceae bacterium]